MHSVPISHLSTYISYIYIYILIYINIMIPKYKQLHECFDISFLTKVITNIVVESKIPKYIPR